MAYYNTLLKKISITLIILLCGLLTGCGNGEPKDQAAAKPTTYTVQIHQQISNLYYNGTLHPKHIVNVSSPVKGTIRETFFQFGKHVKKGDLLFTISSQDLNTKYQQSLSDYLKAKDDFNNSEQKWKGQQELFHLGLMSKNDYAQAMQSHEEMVLGLYQKQQKLKETLIKTTPNATKIMAQLEKLNLHDINAVFKALNQKQDEWRIVAPATGVVLFPQTKDSSSHGKIAPGDPVKEDEVVLSVGDLTGLSMQVQVNEVDVLKIHEKMSVDVTGSAFPGLTLHGFIKNVAIEATSGNSGLPVFDVDIEIPKITEHDLHYVHIGMSAQVNITIKSKPQLRIPLAAMKHDQNGYSVLLKSEDKVIRQPVVPAGGSTSTDTVMITNGLKPGDVIVLPH